MLVVCFNLAIWDNIDHQIYSLTIQMEIPIPSYSYGL